MGDVSSIVSAGLHPDFAQDTENSKGSMMPWWAHVLVAEWIGCPEVCVTVPAVAKSLNEVCNAASVAHNEYTCRRSGRRLSLPLPSGNGCTDGVTPAMFANAWRRKSRELDDLSVVQLCAKSHRPVLCPHFGCCHEASSSSSASLHAASCSKRGNGGFAYAKPAEILAELDMRKQREVAKVLLDANLGGSLGQSPRTCICEVCRDGEQWVLKLRQDGLLQKIPMDSNLCIHRGWTMDHASRTALERGAFPRGVDRSAFLISHRVSDESYRYSRSCGVHVLSGWVLCDDESSRGHCSNTSGDQSHKRLVMPEGCWDRTLALVLPSRPGSAKWRRAEEVRRRFNQGCYSSLYLYIPKIIDLSFSVLDTDDSWQAILARHLEQNGSKVSSQVRAEVTSLLRAECPRPVTEKDLDEEYDLCSSDILFLTFLDQTVAEVFARWLENAIWTESFKLGQPQDCEIPCCYDSPPSPITVPHAAPSKKTLPLINLAECFDFPRRENANVADVEIEDGNEVDHLKSAAVCHVEKPYSYFEQTGFSCDVLDEHDVLREPWREQDWILDLCLNDDPPRLCPKTGRRLFLI